MTEKAKLLRDAKRRKGLTNRQIAALIERKLGKQVEASSVSFALTGAIGNSGEVFHGMRGDGLSRLVAKVLGVSMRDLEAAHDKDIAQATQRKESRAKKATAKRRELIALVEKSPMKLKEAVTLVEAIKSMDDNYLLALDASARGVNRRLLLMVSDQRIRVSETA